MSSTKVLILLLVTLIRLATGYRYVIIPKDDRFDRCLNKTCENGALHSICYKDTNISPECTEFKWLEMTAHRRVVLINGHNGIRNKLAHQWGIGNMFILHWDHDLAKMARGFITRCIIGADSCNYLYNQTFTVGQTYYYSPKMPLNRFVVTIMRAWFLEINLIKKFDEYIEAKPPNVTVMANPTTEFFGCAAAEMFGGHMMRCYYSPAPDGKRGTYVEAKPCKACPEDRLTCSRLFKGLCGLDLPLPSMAVKYQILNFNFLYTWIMLVCLV